MKERAKPYVVALLGVLLAIALVHQMHRCGDMRTRNAPSVTLESKHVRFEIFRDGRVTISSDDRARVVDASIVTEDDDGARAIAFDDLRARDATHAVATSRAIGEIDFAIDAARDALDFATNAGDAGARDAGDVHAIGVRVPLEGRGAFLGGRGELSDLSSEYGKYVVALDALHPLGVVANGSTMHVEIESLPSEAHAVAMRASVPPADARVTIALTTAGGAVWSTMFDRAKIDVKRVHGVVTGAPGASQVVGLDDQGAPQMRVATDVAGRFDFGAPTNVTSFYASASATRTSAPIQYPPGTEWPLKLDVSDGGELHVRAIDFDTREPITARLVVHGVDGTLDPSFGPDYRASGAGPLIDALRGDATTPLPSGKYRVAATKGIEWTIDARVIEIEPGKRVDLELALRHVVPTPDEIACDLHVHARPSFDAPVAAEDRVLSLVAAGIDFAVPTEHNLVGNYDPAIKVLDVGREFHFVPGVEVTTYMPKFGHFGVFPYPTDKPPPPFKHTDVSKVFAGARAGDPNRALVVHHPRLTREIGYFTAFGYKPDAPPPASMRMDFDAIEIFNGYESGSLDHVEVVLADYYALLNAGHRYAATGSSDSHRIQYQWAGYPRTMVHVANANDTAAVVRAIKAGHATVTTGPIVELTIEGASPGGDVSAKGRALIGRLVVRAAPWVDVTSAKIVVGGRTTQTFDVPSRPTSTGPEPGALEEAAARTLRLDAEVRIDAADVTQPTWALAVVRGTRALDDILPFMPIQPFAVTNPIFIHK